MVHRGNVLMVVAALVLAGCVSSGEVAAQCSGGRGDPLQAAAQRG